MLSEKKMVLARQEIQFLGMNIKDGKYQPGPHISQELLKFPDENLSKRQVQQFLGIVNYIRDFVPKIASYVSSLTKMLKKNPIPWGKEQTDAVKWLKKNLQNLPPLHIPCEKGRRILQTDASDHYWGAVLLQEVNGKRLICGYTSGKFKDSEIHYHSTYKEILAVKNGIKKFNFHLIGYEFLVELDMSSFPKMLEFRQKEIPQPQLLRWMQWFSRYNYQVKHIKGKDNVVADFLSRPQETAKQKVYPIMMMNDASSSGEPDPMDDIDFPPDLDCSMYPWDTDHLSEKRSEWEVKLFRHHGGHMLNPIGVSPKYPFGHIFMARADPWPEELKWILWYLTHEYHILVEFHRPSFRKQWKLLSQSCKEFLAWFGKLSFWRMQFCKDPEYLIVHFHRPVMPIIAKSISGYAEAFMEIYSEKNWSILEFEDLYSEAQRFIFAQNKVIPKEIWPVEGFNFNDRPENEIYYERIKSAGDMYYYELTHQNSQPPEEPSSPDPYSMEGMKMEIEKTINRSEDRRQWNKSLWREKRSLAGLDRWEWATCKGISVSDYSTESESISDEDSLMDQKFDGEWEIFKRTQRNWDESKWKGKRFSR